MNKILFSFFAFSMLGTAFASENSCGCEKIIREETSCCAPTEIVEHIKICKVDIPLKSCCA